MKYEHRTAYRHECGEVEGFRGVGDTKAKAKEDAVTQIKRKLDIIADVSECDAAFDKSRLIESPSRLTKEELELVQRDWKTNVRY